MLTAATTVIKKMNYHFFLNQLPFDYHRGCNLYENNVSSAFASDKFTRVMVLLTQEKAGPRAKHQLFQNVPIFKDGPNVSGTRIWFYITVFTFRC